MTLRYARVADKDVETAAERIGAVIADICDSVDFACSSTYPE